MSILTKNFGGKTWKIGITICEDLWVNESIEKEESINKIQLSISKRKDRFIAKFSVSLQLTNKPKGRLLQIMQQICLRYLLFI